jgi:hypothetical protein
MQEEPLEHFEGLVVNHLLENYLQGFCSTDETWSS